MDEITLIMIAGPIAMLVTGALGYLRLRAEGRRLDIAEKQSNDTAARSPQAR